MRTKRGADEWSLDHVLGPTKQSRSRRQRWLDRGQPLLALGICVGAVWWLGWKSAATHAVSEAITAGLVAVYAAGRAYWARRSFSRYEGQRRNRPCSCGTCRRVRADALAAGRPTEAVKS